VRTARYQPPIEELGIMAEAMQRILDADGDCHAAATQTETGKWHPSSIFLDKDAGRTANRIGRAINKEVVQMFAAPIKGALKNFVEFGESGVACHQQTPPYQRTHHKARREKVQTRLADYRRSAHTDRLEFDPQNLPLLVMLKHTDHSRVFVARRAAWPERVSSGGAVNRDSQ
jgi:hypothetical protein